MGIDIKNIFEALLFSNDEIFENILSNDKFRLERIISRGQSTASGDWYDQDWDEWVLLLSGSAGIYFEGENDNIILKPGDYLLIPAHKKHRVEWTESKPESVWLAIHF